MLTNVTAEINELRPLLIARIARMVMWRSWGAADSSTSLLLIFRQIAHEIATMFLFIGE